MLKSKTPIIKIIKTALVITLFICTFLILNYYQIKILKVVTSSMEPVIKKGSLVVIKKDNILKIGDIVSYQTTQSKNIVTHRITNIFKLQEKYYFYFKGDGNESQDPNPISESEIIGKYWFSIPLLGNAVDIMRNSKAMFILLGAIGGVFSGKLFKEYISG